MKNFYDSGMLLPINKNCLPNKYSKNRSSKSFTNRNLDKLFEDQNSRLIKSKYLDSYATYLATKIYELQMLKYFENNTALKTTNKLHNHNGKDLFKTKDHIIRHGKIVLKLILIINFLFFNSVIAQKLDSANIEAKTNLEKSIKKIFRGDNLTPDQIGRIKKFYPEADLEKYPYEKIEIDTNLVPVLKVGDTLTKQILNMRLRIINGTNQHDSIKLSAFSEKKWIILNGWADWCAPCKESLNLWEGIIPEYKEDVAVFGLHLDFDYKAPTVVKRLNWTLPHIIGGEAYLLSRLFFGQIMAGPSILIHNGKFYGVVAVKPKDRENVIHLLEGSNKMAEVNLRWLVKPLKMRGGDINEN